MIFLDYQTYKRLGGKVEEAAFPYAYQNAFDKLSYFTLGKIEPCAEVQRCLTRMIEAMNESDGSASVSSFSNGNVSVSFKDEGTLDDRLYQIAEELLPISMLSRCL